MKTLTNSDSKQIANYAAAIASHSREGLHIGRLVHVVHDLHCFLKKINPDYHAEFMSHRAGELGPDDIASAKLYKSKAMGCLSHLKFKINEAEQIIKSFPDNTEIAHSERKTEV